MKNCKVDWLVTELNVIGGTESLLRNLAPHMRNDGWDIRVISLINGGRWIEELRQEGIPVIELGMRAKWDLCVIPRLWRIWKRSPPQIIHTHLFHAGILGRLIARSLKLGPVIVHQHGPEKDRTQFRIWLDRLFARWATFYIASCQAVSDILQTRELIPPDRVLVVYNGIALPPGEVLADQTTRPKDWPAPEGHLAIACVGRLAPEKGQAMLIDAIPRITSVQTSVHVVFFGAGPSRSDLAMRIKRRQLDAQFTFAGASQDVHTWLPHFDLFILPSEWEGISLALLEAMAAGLPIIATAVGGTPEVIADGQTGLLIPPNDPQALAQAIDRLLLNRDERRRLGYAARERVKQAFTLERACREIAKLYAELCESDPGRRPP